jgi:hypothetical protein
MSDALTVYDIAERSMAEALGLDIANLSHADRIRLSTAVALRLEHDRLEGMARAGQPFDITRFVEVGAQLAAMFPASSAATPDDGGALDRIRSMLADIAGRKATLDATGGVPGQPSAEELRSEIERLRGRSAKLELALENEMKISALLRKKLELVS